MKIWHAVSSEDIIADRQTYRQTKTDRHAHHNTPLPYWGRRSHVLDITRLTHSYLMDHTDSPEVQ